MNNKEKIFKLERLYTDLLEMINIYAKGYIDCFIIKKRLEDILMYINGFNSDKDDSKFFLDELMRVTVNFYPPRGGLSDFVITIDDKIKEEKLNQRLENIQDEIDKILRSV